MITEQTIFKSIQFDWNQSHKDGGSFGWEYVWSKLGGYKSLAMWASELGETGQNLENIQLLKDIAYLHAEEARNREALGIYFPGLQEDIDALKTAPFIKPEAD